MKLFAFLSSDRFAWGFAFVFLVQAFIFFFVSPNMTIYHWICVLWLGLMSAIRAYIMDYGALSPKKKEDPLFKKKTLFIVSSAFYVLGVMAMFPISVLYSIIFLSAIGFWFMGNIGVQLVSIAGFAFVFGITAFWKEVKNETAQREEFMRTHELEQVVLKYVDKKDPENIQVLIEGKGIYGFDTNQLGRNLKDGDTIQVLIYKNKIVCLER